ncbi:outer membrane protein assembly factor BamB family protein [Posidoniimonas polymericola]|nr:PQQ-binding-like beta-propeller repeat protein [Posidoniimonas polymericola]
MRILGTLLLVVVLTGPSAAEVLWPQFRGPDGQGRVRTTRAPLAWGEGEGVRWKTPLPGRGWSSPVVLGDHIWVTTAEQQGPEVPGEQGTVAVDRVALSAVCVSRDSGEIVHRVRLFDIESPEKIHAQNSYASPTCCLSGDHLICHFGRNGTACLDAQTAEVLWKKAYVVEHYVGAGSSPVMCEGKLILVCDGADQQFVVALDPVSGNEVWRQDRPPFRATNPDVLKSFATPLAVEHAGQVQLVAPGAQWIVAYRPSDGEELWRYDHGAGFSLVPRPVTDGRTIYYCSGFAGDEVLALPLGESGKLDDDQVRWRYKRQAPHQPSPLLMAGRLLMVSDQGIFQCLDANSGKLLWKKRLGGNYSASLLQVGDCCFAFSKEGVATCLDAGGKVLHENQLDGEFHATPAIVDDEWIIRTDTHLYAIGNYDRT